MKNPVENLDSSEGEFEEEKDLYPTELFEPTVDNWNAIKDAVVKLETDEFGEDAFEPETLEADFLNPANTAVILRDDKTGEVIGFSYAEPLSLDDEDLRELEREDNGTQTAYISDTVISPEYRGRKLAGKLTGQLIEDLVNKGFRFLERDAAVANQYAENIIKNNQDSIIFTGEPEDSMYGPQRFIRMRIEKNET